MSLRLAVTEQGAGVRTAERNNTMNRRKLIAREMAVSELVAQGRTNAETAKILSVSLATAKRNLNNVMIKWNCANRTQVSVEVIQRRADVATGPQAVARVAEQSPSPAALLPWTTSCGAPPSRGLA